MLNINNDDVMMTKVTISEICSFHSQVITSSPAEWNAA